MPSLADGDEVILHLGTIFFRGDNVKSSLFSAADIEVLAGESELAESPCDLKHLGTFTLSFGHCLSKVMRF